LSHLQNLGLAPTGLVLAVLRERLPLPATLAAQGVTEAQFYGNPYAYSATPLDVPFNATTTTAELQTTFFAPLAALAPLFSDHRYLTRFATFISPEEMTKDPRFVTNAELPDVEPQHVAVAHMLCGDQEYDVCHAPVRLHLEDGADVTFAVAAGAPATCDSRKTPLYDRAGVDKLPSSDVGWLRDAEGPGHQVIDNRSAITAGVAQQNASVPVSTGGCACSARGRARPVVATLMLLGVLVARRRRRR
jgi:MYXO-CTERM domain-containing protein